MAAPEFDTLIAIKKELKQCEFPHAQRHLDNWDELWGCLQKVRIEDDLAPPLQIPEDQLKDSLIIDTASLSPASKKIQAQFEEIQMRNKIFTPEDLQKKVEALAFKWMLYPIPDIEFGTFLNALANELKENGKAWIKYFRTEYQENINPLFPNAFARSPAKNGENITFDLSQSHLDGLTELQIPDTSPEEKPNPTTLQKKWKELLKDKSPTITSYASMMGPLEITTEDEAWIELFEDQPSIDEINNFNEMFAEESPLLNRKRKLPRPKWIQDNKHTKTDDALPSSLINSK